MTPTYKLNLQNIFFCMGVIFAASANDCLAQEKVNFNREVQPILAKACFACHGPDEEQRQSDLRLDIRSAAVDHGAIVPGDADSSTLMERIQSDDEDTVMPPSDSGHELTPAQKLTLKEWIEQGANYTKHWAFEAPVQPPVPASDSEWATNSIDRFVWQRFLENDITPNPTADKYTLVRRVYLDLIGLPPTIAQADEFVNSRDPNAYEKLVDELLASSHYGERWAEPWLDLARYSDTNGYEKDRERSIWPYRDWVIRALNQDKPYDQFTIEQLAGDMLDNPTQDQLIATGFHRNTMLNEEGGIDPLEFRFLALVDRVATTGTVWLGLTTGCAQCHTHKYDPISHTDYYRLMALMNNADEPDFRIPDKSKSTEIKQAKSKIEEAIDGLVNKFEPVDGEQPESVRRYTAYEQHWENWLDSNLKSAIRWDVMRPTEWKTNLPKLSLLDDGSLLASGDTTKRDEYELRFQIPESTDGIRAIRLEVLPDSRLPSGGPGNSFYEGRKGDFFVSEISASIDGQPVNFSGSTHDFSATDRKSTAQREVFDGNGSSGWKPGNHKRRRLKLVLNLDQPIKDAGMLTITLLFERHYVCSLGRFRFSTTTDSNARANPYDEDVEQILAKHRLFVVGPREDGNTLAASDAQAKFNSRERDLLEKTFLMTTPVLAEARKPIEQAKARLPNLDETMVFRERPKDNQRKTFRHHRGEYLTPKELVEPGLPNLFVAKGPQSVSNRLEFAKWLVGPDNPLVARVAVNRAWREFFGAGIVRTNGDFGVQSELPTHPHLIDWLATEYRDEMKWSTKQLHRLIVTSSTYRQASETPAAKFQRDPQNRSLARGPSYRVSGERVRDIALQATGALSDKMYGRGVRPPQPNSVTALAFGSTKWNPSKGEDRFRRSIYTFRKRTASFAAYSVFDGPSGEACEAKRNRSNTPLQALTVLNDKMYLELVNHLASRRVKQAAEQKQDPDVESDLVFAFRSFLTRPPSESELKNLVTFYQQQLDRLKKGELNPDSIAGKEATDHQAALAMVARVIMNLDETITKR